MQYDNNFYNDMVNTFESYMKKVFGSDIKEIEKICKFECRGYFLLIFDYYPCNYKIEIEDEMSLFNFKIIDCENAFNHLYGIKKYSGNLNKENILQAIDLLKSVLDKNNFNLYFQKDGKLYRKNSEGIKRVKDIKELYNG